MVPPVIMMERLYAISNPNKLVESPCVDIIRYSWKEKLRSLATRKPVKKSRMCLSFLVFEEASIKSSYKLSFSIQAPVFECCTQSGWNECLLQSNNTAFQGALYKQTDRSTNMRFSPLLGITLIQQLAE